MAASASAVSSNRWASSLSVIGQSSRFRPALGVAGRFRVVSDRGSDPAEQTMVATTDALGLASEATRDGGIVAAVLQVQIDEAFILPRQAQPDLLDAADGQALL